MKDIAVGSTNPAKVRAVQQVVEQVWPGVSLYPVEVESGVSDMPLSDAECIAGARRRAQAARLACDAVLGIGLEGGVHPDPPGLMLCGWVVVSHQDGREGVAGTARLPLPPDIARRILSGEELGPVMDEILGVTKSNHRGGAVGTLTGGLVPRSEAFAMAVAYALAPFVAPDFYQS